MDEDIRAGVNAGARPRPPVTLLAYALKWTVILAATLVVAVENPVLVIAVVVMALLLAALWRGSRAAWVLMLVVESVALVSAPIGLSPWWVLPLSLLALGLLLAPPTRRHVGSG